MYMIERWMDGWMDRSIDRKIDTDYIDIQIIQMNRTIQIEIVIYNI